jgi:hypothetical protein
MLVVMAAIPLFTACADGITAPREVGRRAGVEIYMLPELEVPTCKYGGDYPACQTGPSPEGTGIDPGEEPYTPEGGGGEMPPPDSTDEKPCNTSDPVLNSQTVQTGFEDLWSRSNPDAEMSQRLEKAGFIIQTASGFVLQPFPDSWTIGPCGIDVPDGTMPPAGAVGWVHTHPYKAGELLTSCESTTLVIGGRTFVASNVYANDPSGSDGMVSTTWNLPGYVIDHEKITKFVGDPNSPDKLRITNRTGRCGY